MGVPAEATSIGPWGTVVIKPGESVWVVYHNDYECQTPVAVFSSEEKAHACIKKLQPGYDPEVMNPEGGWNYLIEAFVLNKDAEE